MTTLQHLLPYAMAFLCCGASSLLLGWFAIDCRRWEGFIRDMENRRP